MLEEYTVAAVPARTAYYVWGNYIDELLFIWNADNQLAAHALQDHLFSTVALINVTDGTVLERCEYDAYGKATVYTDMNDWQSGTPTTQNYSEYGNPYLFTGRRLDKLDSGSFTTYYYRNRYYDADTGRFLQKDPLGIIPNGGEANSFGPLGQSWESANLFEYVNSNPVMAVDPSGLVPVWVERAFKKLGYELWRKHMVTAPHWRTVMAHWYNETGGRPPLKYTGLGDRRCSDIKANIGFDKLLKCWIAKKYSGAIVPSGSWSVGSNSIQWQYRFEKHQSAGGAAAYTSATEFLGTYTAELEVLGVSGRWVNVGVKVVNISGWTSATRLPGRFRHLFGGRLSLFTDHARRGARYSPSKGGNMSQEYSFSMTVDKCSKCDLP